MAGLAAGIRAGMYGKQVLILEKHNAPGGLNSFYFLGGRKCDVGLHAVTNYVDAGRKGTALVKLFRQLRIPREAFNLSPQVGSRIAFPDCDLNFTNDIEVLRADIAAKFGGSLEGFDKLRLLIQATNPFDEEKKFQSARSVLEEHLPDPLLIEMLLCPLMYYGSAWENDMEFDQFVIMWNALFEEGFARPFEGVRVIIKALLDRYREVGGKRRMRACVSRILMNKGSAAGVLLESGEEIFADKIISTVGWPETNRLAENSILEKNSELQAQGKLSFAETMTFLSDQPSDLGINDTIIFFNDSEKFHYERSAADVDVRSGVICFPNNYAYSDGAQLSEGILRLTSMANYDRWKKMEASDYSQNKEKWYGEMLESALRFLPTTNRAEIEKRATFIDMFTPITVEKFTSHMNGAIYGSPEKQKSGLTPIHNLFIAGTDQGFLGIIGAMLSGVSMANRHILQG